MMDYKEKYEAALELARQYYDENTTHSVYPKYKRCTSFNRK